VEGIKTARPAEQLLIVFTKFITEPTNRWTGSTILPTDRMSKTGSTSRSA
jgi:hypothetical protein